jgi:hypothetical protein
VVRSDSQKALSAGATLDKGFHFDEQMNHVIAGAPDRCENPWAHMVRGLLSSPASRMSAPMRPQRDARLRDDDAFWRCTVKVEERLPNAAFALSWSDPTRCSYREQVWKRATARRAGVCVLSGQAIKRGDAVFRPQARRFKVPLNSGAMILAASLEMWGGCPVDPE